MGLVPRRRARARRRRDLRRRGGRRGRAGRGQRRRYRGGAPAARARAARGARARPGLAVRAGAAHIPSKGPRRSRFSRSGAFATPPRHARGGSRCTRADVDAPVEMCSILHYIALHYVTLHYIALHETPPSRWRADVGAQRLPLVGAIVRCCARRPQNGTARALSTALLDSPLPSSSRKSVERNEEEPTTAKHPADRSSCAAAAICTRGGDHAARCSPRWT